MGIVNLKAESAVRYQDRCAFLSRYTNRKRNIFTKQGGILRNIFPFVPQLEFASQGVSSELEASMCV